jgi:glycosyl transferase family 25
MEILVKSMSAIHRVVYINLDERTDRKLEVQGELRKMFPDDIVERFPAIRHVHGGIGCTMSHIAVLERAKAEGWPNVMIVEDDFIWTNLEAGTSVLQTLLKRKYDVIIVSGSDVNANKATMRLNSCTTTTAYIVAQRYYDTLLVNYKEGLARLQETGLYVSYALDQYWKLIQPKGLWYVVIPIMGYQRPGYSDIEKKVTDYRFAFGIPR